MQENSKAKEQYKSSEKESKRGAYRPMQNRSVMCCPNCKQSVPSGFELCPHCGHRLHSDHCTYCGAPMAPDDLFCGECGGNSQGTPCPICGRLSFRSFCPNCNAAVDELGKEELERAKHDPMFKRICDLAQKIAQAQEAGILNEEQQQELSPKIAELLERYRQLQGSISTGDTQQPEEAAPAPVSELVSVEQGITLTETTVQAGDMAKAIEELNAMMRQMIPDPGMTPQMQRNYYSARKVAVYRTTKVRSVVCWVCNLCGCEHNNPSECAQPELGGTWIYEESEVTTKTYE